MLGLNAHQRQTLNLTTVKTGTGRQRARRNRTYSTVNTVNTGTGKQSEYVEHKETQEQEGKETKDSEYKETEVTGSPIGGENI